MLNIGDLVSPSYWRDNKNNRDPPIGIVIGESRHGLNEVPHNEVRWIFGSHQQDGGYYDDSLRVVSKVKIDEKV